ncbi:hypothetical protein C8Q75DRAFT_809716 [Abortiporus biennis]|nr:hypothetical protein C8Q75DRAFT_809716 [Abortiporus biennis]
MFTLRTSSLRITSRLSRPTLLSASQRPYTTKPEVQNEWVAKLIQRVKEERDIEVAKDPKLNNSYTRCLNALQKLNHPIRSPAELFDLPGLGRKAAPILIRLMEGRSPDGVNALADKTEENFKIKLLGLPGVGLKTALELIDEGCQSMDDILKPQFLNILPASARLSLEFSEAAKPISRETADEALQIIQETSHHDFGIHPTGEYRRDLPFIKELMILFRQPSNNYVSQPTITVSTKALQPNRLFLRPQKLQHGDDHRRSKWFNKQVIRHFESRGLLAGTSNSSLFSWEGVMRIPDKVTLESGNVTWERILARRDQLELKQGNFIWARFAFVPFDCIGAALLASTGDSAYYSDLREHARKLGMWLNEYGLWRKLDKPTSDARVIPNSDEHWNFMPISPLIVEPGEYELVASSSEQAILEELGKPYVEPARRNFAFLK